MSKVVIFGGSGGLAELLIKDFLDMGCFVDSITRNSSKSSNNLVSLNSNFPEKFCNKKVDSHYSEFIFEKDYDILILPQSIFDPNELIKKKNEEIDKEINIGFTELIKITRNFLRKYPPVNNKFKNIAIIGSSSAYSGFRRTTTYCAIKHGLLGFIRALNSEYENTNYRFFLFSMGTMLTEMAKNISDQDPSTYLDPSQVSGKISKTLLDKSNMFEPEVFIKRRTVRFI